MFVFPGMGGAGSDGMSPRIGLAALSPYHVGGSAYSPQPPPPLLPPPLPPSFPLSQILWEQGFRAAREQGKIEKAAGATPSAIYTLFHTWTHMVTLGSPPLED